MLNALCISKGIKVLKREILLNLFSGLESKGATPKVGSAQWLLHGR